MKVELPEEYIEFLREQGMTDKKDIQAHAQEVLINLVKSYDLESET